VDRADRPARIQNIGKTFGGEGQAMWLGFIEDAIRASVMAQYNGLIVSAILDAMDKYGDRGEN
jgi:hypothetical protein